MNIWPSSQIEIVITMAMHSIKAHVANRPDQRIPGNMRTIDSAIIGNCVGRLRRCFMVVVVERVIILPIIAIVLCSGRSRAIPSHSHSKLWPMQMIIARYLSKFVLCTAGTCEIRPAVMIFRLLRCHPSQLFNNLHKRQCNESGWQFATDDNINVHSFSFCSFT